MINYFELICGVSRKDILLKVIYIKILKVLLYVFNVLGYIFKYVMKTIYLKQKVIYDNSWVIITVS